MLLSLSGFRALLFANVRTIFGGFFSALALIPEDPATLWSIALALFRVAVLLGLPVAVMIRAQSRAHFAWLPLLLIGFGMIFGLSLPALSSIGMWLAFLVASGTAAWAMWKRALPLIVLLPWVVCLEPLFGHAPPSAWVWTPERILERCATNDGVRPVDVRADVVSTRYFSVTSVSPSLQLLAGERKSFWVRDRKLGETLATLQGNFWEGCVRDGTAWLGKRGFVCEASEATQRCVEAPGPEDIELDYVDVYCASDSRRVYVSQLLRGGVLEFDPDSQKAELHEVIAGLNLQLAGPRADGVLLGITTTRFVVIDPKTWKVIEARSAGLVAMGIDVCAADGAALVTDFSGRVRLFERGADGAYRVTRATSVPAARRVAWAPGCQRALVTSGDDRHAFLLSRELKEERVFRLGPALRDVTFIDQHTAAVADACTVTYLELDR
ncbi:MAG: hypothetical protein JNM17_20090 [Archangium sp.]|nr:hypothetical protein [Archangium sp.]